jgi:hypothetical protein
MPPQREDHRFEFDPLPAHCCMPDAGSGVSPVCIFWSCENSNLMWRGPCAILLPSTSLGVLPPRTPCVWYTSRDSSQTMRILPRVALSVQSISSRDSSLLGTRDRSTLSLKLALAA